jgi:hypothetical protein
MDTYEARIRMLDLARHGSAIVEGFEVDSPPTADDAAKLRELAADARTLVSDGGYPAEAAWRALDRAASSLIAQEPDPEGARWQPIGLELQSACASLESLLGSTRRETDFRIVG